MNPQDGSALSGAEREQYVKAMFDRIARPYDRLNRAISLGRDAAWRRLALDLGGVGPGHRAVDLGCGTGDLVAMLARRVAPEGSVIGIDLSPNMLEVARVKTEGLDVELRVGSAEATGLPDASADVVTMGWVLRNVGDRQKTYAEILRLLADGGVFLCLDMSRPSFAPLRWATAVYMRCVMPSVVRILGGDREAYRYLTRSTERFPLKAPLAAEMEAAGFEGVRWRSLMAGSIAIHVARKPGDRSVR